jgi:hypothetical protein
VKALSYRSPLGSEPGAEWLRELRNQSGAYVIRSSQTKETLYVGESHTGRLYDAIRHHFVERSKPSPVFGGHGLTEFKCSRHHVEVAIRLTPPSAAVGAQNNLINRLAPKVNVNGYEPDPF